jgi:peptidoglycan/xylan/chitin deacetylase (PgdA/CDA1 family)
LLTRRLLLLVPGLLPVADAVSSVPMAGAHALRKAVVDARYWAGVRSELDRRSWRALRSGVVILMYHAFASDGEAPGQYVVTRRQLRRHLAVMRLLRRHYITLAEYASVRERNRIPPPRTTVVTIDDGYADVVHVAVPIFRRHGVRPTLFVVSGKVGGRNDWDDDDVLGGRPLADWSELRRAVDAGAEIGGHSRTHRMLTALDEAAALEEAADCRRRLGEALGLDVIAFAYPHGDENEGVRRAVAEAGYRVACTSNGGTNAISEPTYGLRRVEIRGDMALWRFALSVALGRRVKWALR